MHLVRVGALGDVGRFDAVDAQVYRRGTRVVCRTARGLEVGEVLAPPRRFGGAAALSDGALLRPITGEDELLLERLEMHKTAAFEACSRRLIERGSTATLIDAELLFDGNSLYFYFLGDADAIAQSLAEELAEAYEAKAQLRRFGETLTEGCGPTCGTEEAAGCGSGGCSTCSMASACGG